MKLDSLDIKLLDLLQKDASLTYQELASLTHTSTPTCQRRVSKLRLTGVIKRIVAQLDQSIVGVPLTAILEVTLLTQNAEALDSFESLVSEIDAVQQCYRVSTGPDFVLVIAVTDMSRYHEFVHRYLTANNLVRNIRTFFSIHRSKFEVGVPLSSTKNGP